MERDTERGYERTCGALESRPRHWCRVGVECSLKRGFLAVIYFFGGSAACGDLFFWYLDTDKSFLGKLLIC